MSPSAATFWAVIAPWLVAHVVYNGSGFAHFVNWTSLVVSGAVCFVIPFLVYVKAVNLKERLLPQDGVAESIPLLGGRGGGRGRGGGGGGDDDDDEDDDEEDALVPPRNLPSVPVRRPARLALPCVPNTKAEAVAGTALLLTVSALLLVQIGVNLFTLVFVRQQGILD